MTPTRRLVGVIAMAAFTAACSDNGTTRAPTAEATVMHLADLDIPAGFDWSASRHEDFVVELRSQGGVDVATEGTFVWLLDGADRVVMRSRVRGGSASFRAKLPVTTTGLKLVYPTTGNVQSLPAVHGGALDMAVAYPTYPPLPGLFYDHDLKPRSSSPLPAGKMLQAATVLVNGDFEAADSLAIVAGHTDPVPATGVWYRTPVAQTGWEPRLLAGNLRMGHPTIADYSFVFQDIYVDAGSEVHFGAALRQPAANEGLRADLVLVSMDAAPVPIVIAIRSIDAAADEYKDWTYVSVSADMPAGTSRVRVMFVAYPGTKQFWVDDAIAPFEPTQDLDGDGVTNDLDDYPSNPLKVVRTVVPYAGVVTQAFEDLWPQMGDYDFNDLVLSHHIEYGYNADNQLVAADIAITIDALGAQEPNGLGLRFLDYDAGSATWSELPAQVVAGVAGATLDPASTNTVLVAQNLFMTLPTYYQNNGEGPSATPHQLNVRVDFDPAAPQAAGELEAEFFLFRAYDRSHEIHRPGLPPTAAADASRFGTADDATEPATAWRYRTAAGLPWGLEVLSGEGGFAQPRERISILQAYPAFGDWATSGGQSNTDWFSHPEEDSVFR